MKVLSLVPLLLVLTVGPAIATAATYTDFSDTAGLTLNGNAATAGTALRLVPDVIDQSGTAFLTNAVAFDATTAFSSVFKFHVATNRDDPTDGFSFLLQNDAAGAAALGAGSQGLGYVGLAPSVAVVFRGRGPSLIGAISGGVDPADLPRPFQPAGYYSGAEGAFYNQDEFAWIDYNPVSMGLSVFLSTTSTKPGIAIMSTTVDVFGTLGPQAYVGFSAGNGGAFGAQDILSWQFNATPVPEAGTSAMLVLGLAVMGLLRRRPTA
jgi:hypothetical protein